MIKNTACFCVIQEIRIQRFKARIILSLFSKEPTIQHRAFRIYLKDQHGMTLISPYTLWVDRRTGPTTDIYHIDINANKEVEVEVDITADFQAELVQNRWIRPCQIVLVDITTSRRINAWYSEKLSLVSKQVLAPSITDLQIYSKNDGLYTEFRFRYPAHEDEYFNNQNIQTRIQVLSPANRSVLEETPYPLQKEDMVENKLAYKFAGTYTDFVLIKIILQNLKGQTIRTLSKIYNPIIRKSVLYIKQDGEVRPFLPSVVKEGPHPNLPAGSVRARQVLIKELPAVPGIESFLPQDDDILEYILTTKATEREWPNYFVDVWFGTGTLQFNEEQYDFVFAPTPNQVFWKTLSFNTETVDVDFTPYNPLTDDEEEQNQTKEMNIAFLRSFMIGNFLPIVLIPKMVYLGYERLGNVEEFCITINVVDDILQVDDDVLVG